MPPEAVMQPPCHASFPASPSLPDEREKTGRPAKPEGLVKANAGAKVLAGGGHAGSTGHDQPPMVHRSTGRSSTSRSRIACRSDAGSASMAASVPATAIDVGEG